MFYEIAIYWFIIDTCTKLGIQYSSYTALEHLNIFKKMVTTKNSSFVPHINISWYIQKIPHKISKMVLRSSLQSELNIGVYGKTVCVPLSLDAIKLSIDYFLRCAELPNMTITKRAYNEQKTLNIDWF